MTEGSRLEYRQKIDEFCRRCPDAESTFGHIVLADYNISMEDISKCYELGTIKVWLQQAIDDAQSGAELIEKLELYCEVDKFLVSLGLMLMEYHIND